MYVCLVMASWRVWAVRMTWSFVGRYASSVYFVPANFLTLKLTFPFPFLSFESSSLPLSLPPFTCHSVCIRGTRSWPLRCRCSFFVFLSFSGVFISFVLPARSSKRRRSATIFPFSLCVTCRYVSNTQQFFSSIFALTGSLSASLVLCPSKGWCGVRDVHCLPAFLRFSVVTCPTPPFLVPLTMSVSVTSRSQREWSRYSSFSKTNKSKQEEEKTYQQQHANAARVVFWQKRGISKLPVFGWTSCSHVG